MLRTAARGGVEVCFANPGTTELVFVAALESIPEIRAVLGLFEGVLSGAADGYARMSGKPALTLTHQGPSFANAMANLHNARRARSPIVNLIGDQPGWHRGFDPPLSSDVAAMAGAVSGWVRSTTGAEAAAARDMAEARSLQRGAARWRVARSCRRTRRWERGR